MQIGDQSYVLGLFNSTSSSANNNGIISLDLSGLLSSSQAAAAATPTQPVAPTPPWNSAEPATQAAANVQTALAGQPIINESAAVLDLPGASADYKKLFALYKGLDTLSNIAAQAAGGNSPEQQRQLSQAFNSGLTQVSDYLSSSDFEQAPARGRRRRRQRQGDPADRQAGHHLRHAASRQFADGGRSGLLRKCPIQHIYQAEPDVF